jgi:hypothetical protein
MEFEFQQSKRQTKALVVGEWVTWLEGIREIEMKPNFAVT